MPLAAAMTYICCTTAIVQGVRFFHARAAGRETDKHVVAVVLVLSALYLAHNALVLVAAPERVATTFQSVTGAVHLAASVAAAGICWWVSHCRRGRDA